MFSCTFHILKHLLKFVLGNSERIYQQVHPQQGFFCQVFLSLWNETEFSSEAKEIFIKEWKNANSCSRAVPGTKGSRG